VNYKLRDNEKLISSEKKKKRKVVRAHVMKAHGGGEMYIPLILYLGTR
jgi:hypothetical protein